MRKIHQPVLLIVLLILTTVMAGCGSSGSSNNNFNDNYPGATSPEFQQAMLEEINFARANPGIYAETRLKSYQAAGTDNGAYQDMKQHAAVGVLELQTQLCSAASKYAQYMAEKNVFSHTANGTPEERCRAEGYDYFSGENIAAGSGNDWGSFLLASMMAANFCGFG